MPKPFVRVAPLQQNQAIVDKDGKPNPFFMRALNDTLTNLGEAINTLAALPIIQDQLDNLDAAVAAAQAAADAAQGSAGATQREAELVNSFIIPATVTTATDTDITVISHDRQYADAANTVVSVTGATFPAPGPGVAYIYYVDPARTGGVVTYLTSASPVAQTGDTHVVEAVGVPAMGAPPVPGGGGPRPPWYVEP